MNDFCVKLADILDVAEVKESDLLTGFSTWDSLSVLSIIAMLDSKYGLNVTAADLRNVGTVGDLWNLIQRKQRA